jgi:ABC-2 type transport system permease protein
MNTFSLLLSECAAELRKAARTPAFAVPTLVLPIAFYALFGIALARPGSGNASYLMATYGVFAMLGPALFGFGAGVAAERENGQLALKRVAPLPLPAYLGAKLLTCLGFSLVVLVVLYALAAWGGGVALPRWRWAALLLVHLAGAVPTCLLGLTVGLRLGSSGAMGVTNLLFLALAVLGGLWIPVYLFPDWMQGMALVTPTFHLAGLALMVSGRTTAGQPLAHILALAAFTVLFAATASRAWRRAQR